MYRVFDEETENHRVLKRLASPFSKKNWIVARGWKDKGDAECSYKYFPTPEEVTPMDIPEHIMLLVGFNLPFDLLWEMRYDKGSLKAFYKRGGKIWDCQYAEYLLNGQVQAVQMASLDECAVKYGGETKIDEVKALWAAGVLTSEVPEDLLIDYLVGPDRKSGDIGNTEKVFLGQIKLAVKQGQIKMIQDRMDGLLATTEMQFNGLKIDMETALKQKAKIEEQLMVLDEAMVNYIPELPDGLEFNWGSGHHCSALIFGGLVKYKQVGEYKEDDGSWAVFKPKAPCPLFNKKVLNPDLFHYYWDRDKDKWSRKPDAPAPEHKGFKLLPASMENGVVISWKLVLPNGSVMLQDEFAGGKKKGDPRFKSEAVQGQRKTKILDKLFQFKGYTIPEKQWAGKLTDGGGIEPVYSTSGDVIDALGNRNIPFLKDLAKRQTVMKELSTYYSRYDAKKKVDVGMLTCVDPDTHFIHHSINHTSTITSRLSSSDPNLQNLTRADMQKDGTFKSEVKRTFVSRFGKDGRMLEIDYSQLEVVAQGVLSGDAQLCADLRAKIDFHCKRVSQQEGCTYEEALLWCKNEDHAKFPEWKPKRTGAKNFSFQRAYGAGAAAISLATGIPVDKVKLMIETEERMYPGVVRFNEQVAAAVLASSEPFQSYDPETDRWKTYKRGQWVSPTGTIYSFRSYNAPDYMKTSDTTYNPPEMKNYPVQGTGGEFVQAMGGRVWRHMIGNDNYNGKAFLVNTVHDCYWLDCHKDVVHQVAKEVTSILQSIPEYYNERYGMNITVPFPVEAEYGLNMLELKHLHEDV